MGATRTCAGCSEPFRKGKRRGVLQEDGSVHVLLVCTSCASRCFSVVRPIGHAAHLCMICKTMPARICSGCARRARAELVAPILSQLAAMVKVYEIQKEPLLVAAYEHAMRALESEAEKG